MAPYIQPPCKALGANDLNGSTQRLRNGSLALTLPLTLTSRLHLLRGCA